jgi:hypothetical protein
MRTGSDRILGDAIRMFGTDVTGTLVADHRQQREQAARSERLTRGVTGADRIRVRLGFALVHAGLHIARPTPAMIEAAPPFPSHC